MEIAVLGLGCFWGPEIKFSKVEGIIRTEVGYCGGKNKKKNKQKIIRKSSYKTLITQKLLSC